MYFLDTNIIIYYLKRDPEVVEFIEKNIKQGSYFYISVYTELELFAYPKITPDEYRNIENILRSLTIFLLDSRLARDAASFKRDYNVKASDSIIAATALATGTTLVTRNVKDFKRIPNLQILKI